MNELEQLAAALKRELGDPPETWQSAQRARLIQIVSREQPRRRPSVPIALGLAAALAVIGALVFWPTRPRRSMEVERWLVAEELRDPFRLGDGSSISLAPGGRGRLFANTGAVRFDLHQGRAQFDVTPGQGRTWVITAGRNEVRVVGTRFTVLYGPLEAFEVTVERGLVSVRVPERNANIELGAGDHLQGGPGRLEVLHGGSAVHAAVAATALESAREPLPLASANPSDDVQPARPETPNADWQARYRDGRYAESLALLRTSGLARRLDELPAGALADIADTARLGGDPELAIRALDMLLRRFPRAPEARDGKFLLGRIHALRGDAPAAIAALEGYLEAGESARYSSEARGRLMELYSARGDLERARSMARRYLERAPAGPYRRLAHSLVTRGR